MLQIWGGHVLLALLLTSACSALTPVENNAGIIDGKLDGELLTFTGGVPLSPGDTIFLDKAEVQQEDAWTLSRSDITIQGLEGSKTVITCAPSKNALTIRAPGAKINNVIFRNCTTAGAVLIKNPGNQDVVINAEFHNVEFHDNVIEDYLQSYGAAISVGDYCSATITSSVFTGNTAPAGGAISVSTKGMLSIKNCDFESNVGKFFGGGAIFSSGVLKVSKTTFSNCQSLSAYQTTSPSGALGRPREAIQWYTFPEPGASGGAIFINGGRESQISESSFKDNLASAGGALSASYNAWETETRHKHVFEVKGCSFEGNRAFTDDEWADADMQLGGAIYLSVIAASIEPNVFASSFKNNSARFGGAIHVVTPDDTSLKISRCNFRQNRAELGGGAVLLRNTGQTLWKANDVVGNFASLGGGLLLTNNAFLFMIGQARGGDGTSVSGKPSLFENNTALDGGAIACVMCGATVLQDPIFKGNLAGRNGGGMSIENAVTEVFLQNADIAENTALRGGGVYVNSVPHFRIVGLRLRFSDSFSRFSRNRASIGGALYVSAENREKNKILISQTRFLSNEAAPLTSLSAALNDAYTTFKRPPPDFSNFTAEESCDSENGGGGGGGGACLLLDNIPKQASADVVLTKLHFVNNTARVGGGLFLKIGEPWNGSEVVLGCPPNPELFTSPCRQISLIGANFDGNQATREPALFASNTASIPVACSRDDELISLKSVLGLSASASRAERACITMKRNKSKD